jgi:GxxExxY protein
VLLAWRLHCLHLDIRLSSDGTLIGEFFADFLVDGILVIELKANKTLLPEHEAQILGYLKSARLEHGLLINFGSYKFQIRKFAWSEQNRTEPR